MSLEADGVDRFAATVKSAGDQVADLAGLHTQLGADTLRAAEIPVRTGELLRSSYVDADAAGFALSAAAPYAGIVHARNPFFTRAMQARADTIADAVEAHTATAVGTITGA